MRHLGLEGYRRLIDYCMGLTRRLVERARGFGVEPLVEPVMNVVVLDVGDTATVRQALAKKGWSTSITRDPVGMRLVMRLVLMPHLTESVMDEFLDDLEGICG